MANQELSGRRVLVVDDEAVFAETLLDGLQTHFDGLEVQLAHDGEQALEVLSRTPIDLVITDVSMPKLDGLGLVAGMVSRGHHVPVVVVTAFATWEIERGAKQHGVACVMDKPIDFDRLMQVVETQLSPGASGSFRGVTLGGLLQLLETEKRSCSIHVEHVGAKGLIGVDAGQLSYCELGDRHGLHALSEFLSWDAPDIRMDKLTVHAASKDPVLPMPLGAAMLESARIADEGIEAPDVDQMLADRFFEDILVDESSPPPDNAERTRPNPNPAEDRQKNIMSNIQEATNAAMDLEGAIAFAVVDYESGMCLAQQAREGFPIEVAAAGNKEVVKSKLRVMKDLGIGGSIDDILITLQTQYHLIRLTATGSLFLYMAIDREKGNLAMARHRLAKVESQLEV